MNLNWHCFGGRPVDLLSERGSDPSTSCFVIKMTNLLYRSVHSLKIPGQSSLCPVTAE